MIIAQRFSVGEPASCESSPEGMVEIHVFPGRLMSFARPGSAGGDAPPKASLSCGTASLQPTGVGTSRPQVFEFRNCQGTRRRHPYQSCVKLGSCRLPPRRFFCLFVCLATTNWLREGKKPAPPFRHPPRPRRIKQPTCIARRAPRDLADARADAARLFYLARRSRRACAARGAHHPTGSAPPAERWLRGTGPGKTCALEELAGRIPRRPG